MSDSRADTMTNQLKAMMLRTGSPYVKRMEPSIIREAPWLW